MRKLLRTERFVCSLTAHTRVCARQRRRNVEMHITSTCTRADDDATFDRSQRRDRVRAKPASCPREREHSARSVVRVVSTRSKPTNTSELREASAVVEERVVQADERACRGRSSARAIASARELVRDVGRADPLRDVAPAVVAPGGSSGPRPPRRREGPGATRRRRTATTSPAPPSSSDRRPAVVGEVGVVHPVERREPPGAVAARARPRSGRRPSRSPQAGCGRRSRRPDTGCGRPTARPRAAGRAARRRSATGRPRTSGGLRHAVLAITWQSSPSSGSITSRIRGWPIASWHAALRFSIS